MTPSSFSTALPGIDLDDDIASEVAVSKPSTPTLDKESSSPSLKAQNDAVSFSTLQSSGGPLLKNGDLATKLAGGKTESLKLPPLRSPRNSMLQIPKRNLSSAPISMESYLQQFHAIQWIALQQAGLDEQLKIGTGTYAKGTPVISIPDARPLDYDQKVQLYLDELYKHINTTASSKTRGILNKLPQKSWADVEQALANMIRGKLDEEAVIHAKRDLLAASKAIFQIFLPLDNGGIICSKYWGAMHRTITVR